MRNSTRPTLLILALIGIFAVPAARALVGSVFEASDGDLTSASGVDWDRIAGTLEVGYDEPTGQTDDSLGGKEDDPEPSVDFGSIPNNKSDLLRFYVHHESVEVGDGSERDFLYLAWVRANTLGTANMDFEFNQADQLSANGRTPVRTDGDMLVTFGFSAGGNVVELGLAMWTETGPCEASPSPPCWGPLMPLAGVAEGAVNFTDVFDPVTGATLADRTFGEAAIDLTGAGVFDRDECVSFGSAYVKSRSSDSFTSAMKDLIRPIDVSVTNCATVTVRKNAVPDDAQEFSFTPSADLAVVDVILDDDPSSTLPSSHSFVGRFEGTQTILERPAPGWDLTGLSCVGAGEPERDETGGLTGLVTILAETGETVDCTWVNTKRGRLVVDQVTLPGGDPQSFGFALVGGPEALASAFALTGSDSPLDSGPVRPGTYAAMQQDDGPEWDLVSSVCSDGSPASAIVVDPGETVTCTFTNVKRGVLIVDEITVPADDPQTFSFALSGGPDSVSDGFALADASAPRASGFVRPGTYAVVQQDDGPEWDLASSVCSDGSPASAVSLSPGETVTCAFTNVRRGSITVDVVTTPSGDPQAFSFVLSGGPDTVNQAFALADASTPHASGLVKPGSYAVAAAPAGAEWDLVSSSCTDGSAPGAIGLAAGESLTCTFHYVKRARVVVAKIVTNEPPAGVTWDPALHPFDFSAGWGASFTLHHGESETSSWIPSLRDYTISESAPRGWYTTSECVHADGSRVTGGASISVEPQPGEQVACTFFNELRTHPGSSGFWRNWDNHYTTTQFRTILATALAGTPIYATLFDPYTGALAPDAAGRIDAIYSATGTTAHLLREVTSTLLNLGVSKNPAIEPLQRNDDICLECVLDLDEIPGADAMLRSLAPCELPDSLRIADAVAVAEAAWNGNVATGTWNFGLDGSQLGLLDQVFGGINQGSAVVADVTLYPAELTCVSAPGPVTFTWYRDADDDGHGVLSPRTQTCDGTAPSGYAATRNDCSDAFNTVWPGASEVCDGVANDCAAPGWPALPASERDNDGDGSSACGGDCNDGDPQTFPGTVELCDGRATDCLGTSWPLPPAWDRDDDGDSVSECNGDCDDGNASVRPGAFESCDGVNNDCSDPAWPAVEAFETDADGDGYPACTDCNDAAAAIHPGAAEACNGVDDDCSGVADDGPAGLDPDQDGRPSACDNCPLEWNDRQADGDGDGHGDLCDNCREIRNPDQANGDSDSRGDVCDTCPLVADVPSEDLDRDRVSDVCDNCFNDPNVSQNDLDQDGEGDACDVNDGAIYLRFASATLLEWDPEAGYASWTCRRGDLQVLKTTGQLAQAPGSDPLAEVESGILHPWVIDDDPIPAGRCAFYLVE